MNSLTINSDKGVYEIVIGEIEIKGIGYIIIKEGNDDTVLEAIELIKKYNPKKIYINYKYNYSLAYEMYEYLYNYNLTKAYKEIKLIPLELTNRDKLLNIINNGMKNVTGAKTLSNHDIIELVSKKNTYYFLYKKEYIGACIIEGDYIDTFVIDSKYQHQGLGSMCMSKLLYKCNKDMKVICASDNHKAIAFYEKIGFKFNKVFSSWYEVK